MVWCGLASQWATTGSGALYVDFCWEKEGLNSVSDSGFKIRFVEHDRGVFKFIHP